MKGTKLEPLIAVLAPLPKSYTTVIAVQAKAALAVSLQIKQREASFFRFNKQVVATDKSGNPIRDEESGEYKKNGIYSKKHSG